MRPSVNHGVRVARSLRETVDLGLFRLVVDGLRWLGLMVSATAIAVRRPGGPCTKSRANFLRIVRARDRDAHVVEPRPGRRRANGSPELALSLREHP